jgi:hypothetical protein
MKLSWMYRRSVSFADWTRTCTGCGVLLFASGVLSDTFHLGLLDSLERTNNGWFQIFQLMWRCTSKCGF